MRIVLLLFFGAVCLGQSCDVSSFAPPNTTSATDTNAATSAPASDKIDECPDDPLKDAPGLCGCGIADTDSDTDGYPDCFDQCPNDATKVTPLFCGCNASERDTDGDGTPDCADEYPFDAGETKPGRPDCGGNFSCGSSHNLDNDHDQPPRPRVPRSGR